MLLDLKVINGSMPLSFDKYVNNYTVSVDENVERLEIEYKCEDNDDVKIINNEYLNYGINNVFIEVTSNNTKNIYTLSVYRKKEVSAFKEIETKEDPKSVSDNLQISLIVILFVNLIVIIFTFKFLFLKKKNH